MITKRRIGLILVPNHTNYGAQLQSFATQYVVESFGCDTEILTYSSDRSLKHIKFYWGMFPWLVKQVFGRKKDERYRNLDLEHSENHKLRIEAAKEFKDSHLKNIIICKGYDELVKVGRTYDAILIGSDQMWQPGVSFGNFISMRFVPNGVRKISYATSCGVSSYPRYCYKSSADMWRSFDFLSTREEQGKRLIHEVCGKDIKVRVLPDPTYLLSKEEWENCFPSKLMLNEPYVLCYLIGNDIEQKKCAQRYAKHKNLKLVSIMSNESVSDIDTSFSDINIKGAGPIEFINWIRGTDCLFTDSFHGLAFSVINEVNFFVFYRHKNGLSKTKNSRIDNILKQWSLENRLIKDPCSQEWEKYEYKSIDYYVTKIIVTRKREEGLEYLRQALHFR